MLWMSTILYSLIILIANCGGKHASHSVKKQALIYPNQRIIKVHGSPQVNHFSGHKLRTRPAYAAAPSKGFAKEEVLGPKQLPFFNGPSTNHIKHLSRPPPHFVHKLPSYGPAFPYKNSQAFRTTLSKPPFRKPTLALKRPTSGKQTAQVTQVAHVTQVTPVSQVSTKTTSASASFHSPTFASYSFPSSPVGHIITSNDDNGPIREVPAPDLGPKPTGAFSVQGSHYIPPSVSSDALTSLKPSNAEYTSLGADFSTVLNFDSALAGTDFNSLPKSADYNSILKGTSYNAFLKDTDYSSFLNGQQSQVSIAKGAGSHTAGHHSLDTTLKGLGYGSITVGQQLLGSTLRGSQYNSIVRGFQTLDKGVDIKEIDYKSLTAEKDPLGAIINGANYDSLVNSQQSYKTTIKNSGFNGDFKDGRLNVGAVLKGSTDGSAFVKNYHSVDTTKFGQESITADLIDLYNDGVQSEKHSSGYEVTEHQQLPQNDHLIKSHDGTKLYYAPDPDPSLPVYKVPPTTDPHSTPSNGQNLDGLYIPEVAQGYSYIQDGQQVATLTPQELYQLMNGYPTVLSQPLVTYTDQSHSGMILSGSDQNYYQTSSAVVGGDGSTSTSSSSSSGGSSSSSKITTGISDIAPDEREIAYYLQHPQIHNLLHNTPDSLKTQDTVHSPSTYYNQLQQTVYSPQNWYQSYQHSYANKKSNIQSASPQTFDNSAYSEYEPEASESRVSATVIRQTVEGTKGATSDNRDLLPEDSDSNDMNLGGDKEEFTTEGVPELYQFKNVPEVPFYSSLPNKQAAEALASLQAAGSVASNYLSRVKTLTGDQETDEGELAEENKGKSEERRNFGNFQLSGFKTMNNNDNVDEGEISNTEQNSEKTVKALSSVPININILQNKEERTRYESFTDQQVENSTNFEFKADLSNESFGKRLRPK